MTTTDNHQLSENISKKGSLHHIKEMLMQISNDFLAVTVLETKAASLSLVTMLVLGLIASTLMLTFWGIMMFAVGFKLYSLGISLYIILAILALLQILLATIAIFSIRRCSKKLLFPATRQAIQILSTD